MSRFSRIMAAKKREKFVFITDNVTQNFLEGGENENPRLEDLPQADFGRVHICYLPAGRSVW